MAQSYHTAVPPPFIASATPGPSHRNWALRRSFPRPPSRRCSRRKGALEGEALHPLCDLLGLLLAAAQRRSLVPGGAEAAVRLDGRARSEARRRRHRSLLQGSGTAAGIGPSLLDATTWCPDLSRGGRGLAVVPPPGQDGQRQHGDHGRYSGQPEGVSPALVPEARVGLSIAGSW